MFKSIANFFASLSDWAKEKRNDWIRMGLTIDQLKQMSKLELDKLGDKFGFNLDRRRRKETLEHELITRLGLQTREERSMNNEENVEMGFWAKLKMWFTITMVKFQYSNEEIGEMERDDLVNLAKRLGIEYGEKVRKKVMRKDIREVLGWPDGLEPYDGDEEEELPEDYKP